MSVKAREIVTDALETLIVQADEASLEQSEAAAAIRALNDMMLMWDSKGVDLGYTQVNSMDDPITVPLGAIAGIKANLALQLAPKYNVEPTLLMIKNAKEGYSAIIDLSVEIAEMAYPDTLPQGSGNTYPGYADNTFYPTPDSAILTESGGSIALEDDTKDD